MIEKKTKTKKLLTNISEMDNKSGHKRKIFLLEVKNEYFSTRNENMLSGSSVFFLNILDFTLKCVWAFQSCPLPRNSLFIN